MFLVSAFRDLVIVLLSTAGLQLAVTHESEFQFQRLSPIEVHIAVEAHRRKVDPAVALAVAYQESKFDERATSHTDDFGLFQIHCGREFSWCRRFKLSPKDLFDPYLNIDVGLSVIKDCQKRARRCRGPKSECPHYLYYFNHGHWYVRAVLRNAKKYRELLRPIFPMYTKIS